MLVSITLTTFQKNHMGFQCVALSYFVTLAIIPFLAFIFAITGGLGISDKLAEVLPSLVPSFGQQTVDMLMSKADNIIRIAESGAVGFIGALTFLWSILWLFFQVERVFNNVWGIRKIPRKLYTRFSFYFLVLMLTPFVVLIFGIGIFYYSNISYLIGIDLEELKFLPKLIGWLVFYVIAVLTFSAMYKFIPAPKIRYESAFKSSLIAAAVFLLFQYIYLETQVFVSRLNSVYGALAAIPLFLIWLNFSWQIIIYGAQLTYSYEHVDKLMNNE